MGAMGFLANENNAKDFTTNAKALCMLHVNSRILQKELKDFYCAYEEFYNILDGKIIEKQLFYLADHRYCRDTYPNTLLTSDGFFLEKIDADEFLEHYRNYLSNYWLMQIPHHGSKNNSDAYLLFHIPANVFINFGLNHKLIKSFRHPSPELMQQLTLAGLSNRYFPVNEIRGVKFKVHYNR